MATPTLLADPACLHLRLLDASEAAIKAIVVTTSEDSECPLCHRRSTRIHSRYVRAIADLPWMGCAVHLELHVRRFFCPNVACNRQIFTERLPTVVLTESGGTAQTQVRLEGRIVYDGQDWLGALTFIPASIERECRYQDANLVFSGIWIDPTIQERLSGCDALPPESAMINGTDDVASTLLMSLGREVVAGQIPGAAYVEHLVALMLLRLADPRPAASQSVRRGFPPSQGSLLCPGVY